MTWVPALLLAVFACGPAGAAGRPGAREAIDGALARVAKLRPMDPAKRYTLPVHGKKVSEGYDFFVDRRTPQEVLASGLTTGCGDTAAAFYTLMKPSGFELLFLQSADLSLSNLLGFISAGHTGVGVKDPESGRWFLVDPTAGEVVSEDWDPTTTLYGSGSMRRWIGYRGAPEGYLAQTAPPGDVGRFFRKTLKTAPREALEREIAGLDVVLDPSMFLEDGTTANPGAEAFVALYSGLDRRLGFSPARRVKAVIRDSGQRSGGVTCRPKAGEIDCVISRGYSMDERLFTFIEHTPRE